MIWPQVVDEKGPTEYAIESIDEFIRYWDREAIALRVDGGPAVKALADAAQLKRIDPTGYKLKPRYFPAPTGSVEDVNQEVKNLLRIWALRLKGVVTLELRGEHALVPWLARHVGWLFCMCRARAGGRAARERLKGQPPDGRIAMFGDRLWYSVPDPTRLSSLDERWAISIRLCGSVGTDERIVAVGNEIRLARSARRTTKGQRWGEIMRGWLLRAAWPPRLEPQTPVARPKRRMTNSYLQKYGRIPACPGCTRRSTGHTWHLQHGRRGSSSIRGCVQLRHVSGSPRNGGRRASGHLHGRNRTSPRSSSKPSGAWRHEAPSRRESWRYGACARHSWCGGPRLPGVSADRTLRKRDDARAHEA